MGFYLTYRRSASFAFKGSVPDENYAREIMQLFSLGLNILNEDGSQKLDENGEPIPTYSNENIISFARVWTGFDIQLSLRGNPEMKRISQSNQLDPMRVIPEKRDTFPKMDLHNGHIGDAYPLCTDLAPKAFLRVGAKFRFLGSNGDGDLVPTVGNWEYEGHTPIHRPLFTPDSSGSALHATLCNADPATGACRFQSTVALDTNLPCYGDECSLETIRVVKISVAGSSPFYYEYVQVPCVSFAFFVGDEGGRFIDNVNHIPSHGNEDELIERVCADPESRVAAAGCCTARNTVCFDYRCSYIEERMSFSAAVDRCSADTSWWTTAEPPPLPTGELARWSLYPHEYSTETEACPAGSTTADEASCFEAATAALAAAGEPHFNTPRQLRLENKNNRPSGCYVSTHASNGAEPDVYFNSRANGQGYDRAKLVCADVPEGLASDYRNASKLFCSRKRKRCWHDVEGNCDSGYSFGGHETRNPYYWTEEPCYLQAQVNTDGRVSVVHPGSESTRRTEVNSEGWFRVRWLEGQMPKAETGCGGGDACYVVAGETGSTCVCDIDMATTTVFDDASQVPSQAEVEEMLRIGAPSPDHFDVGTYTICDTGACQARPEVLVYTRGTADSPRFDDTAIFSIVVNQTDPSSLSSARTLYFANKQSVVTIANATHGAGYSFRNPPQFNRLVDPHQRDALYETEALLDHLFYHQNHPPFVALGLIKKLTTSNPSPRYVQAVATAYKTGKYGGRSYSERYGDVGAAVAAVLLDREARSLVLTADATYGKIREPFVKLMHLMRAMEYTPRDAREVDLTEALYLTIGQAVYQSPTVFSFFLPEFAPEGPVQAIPGLVAPEAQLSVLPNIIGMLDGVGSLIFDGLTACSGGFGYSTDGCPNSLVANPSSSLGGHTGMLTFEPADPSSAESVVDELDLLLTSGRLDAHSYTVITEEYMRAFENSSCPVDRTEELCGRLTPGDSLQPGEQITNADGEVLCMTFDGAAQHIGVDGREVHSTAFLTRGTRDPQPLVYRNNGQLRIAGWKRQGDGERFTQDKWSSNRQEEGRMPRAFHSFLSGPCDLLDETAMARQNTYRYTSFDGVVTSIACNAASTCDAPAPPPRSAEYLAERSRTAAKQAVRVAQNLMTASAAFSVTNEPMTSDVDAPVYESRPTSGTGYKALVVVFMNGGADTFNLLVPHSQCDNRNGSEWYLQTRGSAALDLDDVLQISAPAGTQQCETFGIHPRFTALQELYNDGDLSFQANMGPLVKPVTKEQVVNKEATLPAGLFAHNLQTQGAKTLHPQETTGSSGILGRILQAFDDQAAGSDDTPLKGASYSITTDRTMFRGAPTETVLLSAARGMLTYEGSESSNQAWNNEDRLEHLAAFHRLVGKKADSIFAETHNDAVRKALADSERIAALLQDSTLSQNWDAKSQTVSPGHGKRFVKQLEQVSSVINARQAFDAERDVFFVELGGFDTHNDEFATVDMKFNDINVALDTFVDEMKAMGMWDQVVVQALSEFGRSVTTNGIGTDHAWGGNYFTMGGNVKGGTIHGEYPELRIDGPQCVSANGHMMPGIPWEAMWKPISLWLGVEESQLNNIMPNLHEFGEEWLLDPNDVFEM